MLNVLYDGFRVVPFVGQHGLGLVLAQQRDGLGTIVQLAAGPGCKVYIAIRPRSK